MHLPPRFAHCAWHAAESLPKNVPQAWAFVMARRERERRMVLSCILWMVKEEHVKLVWQWVVVGFLGR